MACRLAFSRCEANAEASRHDLEALAQFLDLLRVFWWLMQTRYKARARRLRRRSTGCSPIGQERCIT